MHLILSDRRIDLSTEDESTYNLIDLSELNITNCVGCFSCWVKTPGKCIIRDDAIKVYPKIAYSDKIIYVSKIKYGGYDTIMKTMLERSIPVQQAFIRLLHGETHHVQRNVALKHAVIIGYGNISDEEKNIFKLLNYAIDIIIKLCYIITIAKNKTKKPTGAATNSHRSAPIKRKVALL